MPFRATTQGKLNQLEEFFEIGKLEGCKEHEFRGKKMIRD